MKNERLIAYILIAVGVVTLLSRIGDTDWVWMALVAAALLTGYVTRQNYGFLVTGAIFAGLAVGEIFGTPSGTLISLGVGFLVVDRVEPRPNRWPLYLAAAFAGVGLFVGLGNILNTFWTALAFIVGGIYLLLRDKESEEISTTQSATTSSAESTETPIETPAETSTATPAPKQTARTEEAQATQTDSSVNIAKDTSAEEVSSDAASSPKEAAAEQTERPAEGNSPALDEPELNADAQERYHLLEVWRRERAKAENRPAYIVLRNESLRQIAQQNPQTLDELNAVKGIGPVKLEQYGSAILGVLRGEEPPSEVS